MAVISNDVLRVYFDIVIDDGLQKIAMINRSFSQIQSSLSKITEFKRIESDLLNIGVSANSAGRFIDSTTGKYISLREVIKMSNLEQSKLLQAQQSSSFKLSDMGISQAGMESTVSAQQLIEQSTREAAAQTAHMEKNMHMFNTQASRGVGIMDALGDQAKSIGILMGLLFGGMMLRQWGNNIIRFVLPAMDKIQGFTSKGTKKVNAMKASFEFLKFSMFETFTSTPLFKTFVELVIKSSNWLATIVQKYPGITMIAGVLGGIFVTIGSIAMILAGPVQVLMFTSILKDINIFKGALSGLKKTMTSGILGKLFGGLLVAKAGFDLYNFATGQRDFSWGNIIMTALSAGLGAGFLFNPAAGVITGLVVTASLAVSKVIKDNEAARQLRAIGVESGVEIPLISGRSEASMKAIQVGINKQVIEYSNLLNTRWNIQETLEDENLALEKGPKFIAEQKNELDKVQQKLIDIEAQARGFGGAYEESIRLAQNRFKSEVEYDKILTSQQEKKEMQIESEKRFAEVSQDALNQQIFGIAQSKEETILFNDNMNILLDLMTGSRMETGITNLYLIDQVWVDATTHLQQFADKLDEWASKVVTKTVKIKYEEENRPSRTSGFFESAGRSIDKVFSSSITDTR